MAARTARNTRRISGDQQGASSSLTGAEMGHSRGGNQTLHLQGGVRAGRGHTSLNPARVKNGRGPHGNRKQRKRRDPHQSPSSKDGQQGGTEERPTDLCGCETAGDRHTATTSIDPAEEEMAALPSPVKCGLEPGLTTPKQLRSRLLRRNLLSSTPDNSRLRDFEGHSLHPSGSPVSAPAEELSEGTELAPKRSHRKCKNQARGPQFTKAHGQPKRCLRKSGSSATPPAAKRRKGVRVEVEKTITIPAQCNGSGSQPPARHRARFEPVESESPGQSSLSSDLSIELSFLEDSAPLDSFLQEDGEDDAEDEELPSYLLQMENKPLSITEGIWVWCKLRNYPFWPAMVKSVNHKRKKASVVFIDNLLLDQKRGQKGICVSFRTLKPYDCEERDELEDKAREKYDTAISWCLGLIHDYRIRIGSGSFSGSFMEYFTNDISCPVRRMCVPGGADVTFPIKLDEEVVEKEQEEEEEDKDKDMATDEQGVAHSPGCNQPHCKLMPDREKAARDRANQKLVHFIVENRRLEDHLQAVIGGRKSRWVSYFLTGSRSVKSVYLEDDSQVDQVCKHLLQVYKTAPFKAPCLAQTDEVRFITDVLLPEALIRAIAAVENLSLKQAESKYLQGPCKSERERAEFDLMIEEQWKAEAKNQLHKQQEDLS